MKCYHVDAFTNRIFAGNPAAVCVLETWLPDDLMQHIAAENNLSETAFVVPKGEHYHLRWFTPNSEIDLCGHATLATAFVLQTQFMLDADCFHFHTLSGVLTVNCCNGYYEMDFPRYALQAVEITDTLIQALGFVPQEAWLGRDLVCVAHNEQQIWAAQPDMAKVAQLEGLLLHITASAQKYDCVSRSFAPKLGIVEDPVCGSGHCHIAPLWAEKLGKTSIMAYQASARGGQLLCRMVSSERMILAGSAVLYAVADLMIE